MSKRKGETTAEYSDRNYKRTKKWRKENPVEFLRRQAVYREKYRDTIRARHKRWRDGNEEYNSKQKEYRKTPRYKLYRRKLRQRKHDTDIQFRLKETLRARLNQVLKGINKSDKTLKLLGCDIGFLRLYIESRFESWMNWGNYGEWEIDHIIPCAEFDLSKPEQQRMCFHYTNLRPLRAKENADWRKPRPKIIQPEFL